MKKWFTKEIQIALVAIVALLVLYIGLNFLKGLSVFSNSNSYCVAFNDVSGLSASSPVYANGYKVGVVERIDYDYEHPKRIVAVLGLDKQMRVPVGSHAEVSSDFLGNIKINLILSDNPLDFIAVGDTIVGNMETSIMIKRMQMQ